MSIARAGLLFTRDEYRQRVATLRGHMRDRGIEVLLVDQTEFLFYLTGFGISLNLYRACLLPLDGDPVMVLRAVDLGPFQERAWFTDHVAFADDEDPVAVLVRLIRSRGWGGASIGIDEDSYCMSLKRFRQLRSLLPEARFADFSGVLGGVRARKSPAELEYIRRAAFAADQAMGEAIAAARVGTSARDVAAVVQAAYMKHGADCSRAGIVTTGSGDSFLHGNLHTHPMARGEILHVELVPFVSGYGARLMRPVVIGRPSAEQQRIADRLLAIQDRQFAAMRPGASAKSVDRLVREAVLGEGLRPAYPNITGYTLGYYPPSTPQTSDFSRVFLPTSDWLLEEGMTFHMYTSASGIAFSETVRVTTSGIELLTRTPRRLFVV
jgi:Xaa-Pro dipeptidase